MAHCKINFDKFSCKDMQGWAKHLAAQQARVAGCETEHYPCHTGNPRSRWPETPPPKIDHGTIQMNTEENN